MPLNEAIVMDAAVHAEPDQVTLPEKTIRLSAHERTAQERKFSALIDSMPAGLLVLDGQGNISECNPAALDLLGKPLLKQPWVSVIRRCFAPRHDDGHEVSLKDGRRVRLETRSLPESLGQLIVLNDLTETRRLQAQVSRSERLSSLGKMVASLAHQIRTPLSTAMLYAGHLKQSQLDEETRVDCAHKLMSRLTHLEHQIRDMLIFARGETRLAEQVPVSKFLIEFNRAVEPVLQHADVSVKWDTQSVKAELLCNSEALVGALLNLVNNSIEANAQEAGTLKLDIVAQPLGESFLITIRDNGPGIPADKQSSIFEPFYTTKSQGTGLGLAVVKAVVSAHKGTMKLFSDQNGTEVAIQLPLFRPEQFKPKTHLSKQA